MDKLVENGFIYKNEIDDIIYYEATEKLVGLFQGKFYDSVRELQDL